MKHPCQALVHVSVVSSGLGPSEEYVTISGLPFIRFSPRTTVQDEPVADLPPIDKHKLFLWLDCPTIASLPLQVKSHSCLEPTNPSLFFTLRANHQLNPDSASCETGPWVNGVI